MTKSELESAVATVKDFLWICNGIATRKDNTLILIRQGQVDDALETLLTLAEGVLNADEPKEKNEEKGISFMPKM